MSPLSLFGILFIVVLFVVLAFFIVLMGVNKHMKLEVEEDKIEKQSKIFGNLNFSDAKFKLSNITSFELTFFSDNKEIGRFFVKEGRMCFEGSAEESAKKFADIVCQEFDNKIDKIIEERLNSK